ncbi:hypothetical protein CSKR_112918 [Clonorchis sinensis]|uniref:Uncharacterized protein n=1 Tax=Clonorchis sinensis TaxID=79923 RepID=A0A419PMM0_CLOSI|nr:hypothetical protein CSKR_112918 [Clonorchis sinensis]
MFWLLRYSRYLEISPENITNESFSRVPGNRMCCNRPLRVLVGTVFGISRYTIHVFTQCTTRKFAENSTTAHGRFCPPCKSVYFAKFVQLGFKQNVWLTETRGLRLPDESQERRNRSWAVEESSPTL